jgi:hypothetical protein
MGTYLTAAELVSRGFIATITSRNTQDVDILAYNPKTRRTFGIQVKTNSEISSWRGGASIKGIEMIKSPNTFYIFVDLKEGEKPDFYVVNSMDVYKRRKTAKGGWIWFEAKDSDLGNWKIVNR